MERRGSGRWCRWSNRKGGRNGLGIKARLLSDLERNSCLDRNRSRDYDRCRGSIGLCWRVGDGKLRGNRRRSWRRWAGMLSLIKAGNDGKGAFDCFDSREDWKNLGLRPGLGLK